MDVERPRFGGRVSSKKGVGEPDATIVHLGGCTGVFETFLPGTRSYRSYVTYRNLVDSREPIAALFRWLDQSTLFSGCSMAELVYWGKHLLTTKIRMGFVSMVQAELERATGGPEEKLDTVGREEWQLVQHNPQLAIVDLARTRERWFATLGSPCQLEEEALRRSWSAFLLLHRVCRRSKTAREKKGSRGVFDALRPKWQRDLAPD